MFPVVVVGIKYLLVEFNSKTPCICAMYRASFDELDSNHRCSIPKGCYLAKPQSPREIFVSLVFQSYLVRIAVWGTTSTS